MELSKNNINDFEYDLIESLGFNGTKNYFIKNGILLRIKNHTPDWDNFRSDLNNNDSILKVINVTVGDYENTDFRRNKADLNELKNDYPGIEFFDITIEDGEDLNTANKKIKKLLKSNKIGMKKLKKGSAEAKRFMAKIRSMKGKTTAKKSVGASDLSLSGWKKGSTKFVEAGEKRPKRNGVLVRRKKSGENKGSFTKFRTISGIGLTDETKRLKQLATQSKSPLFKKVAAILISDAKGYGSLKSLIEDVLQYGLQSGMVSELIYYKDTLAWYKKYKKEIAMMLRDTMSELGVDSPKDVFGRNWDNDDPFAEDSQNQNLLAWYSFEETARNIGYSLGYEI